MARSPCGDSGREFMMVDNTFNAALKKSGSSKDEFHGQSVGEPRPSVRPEKVAQAKRLLQQASYPNAEVVAGVAARLAEILHPRGPRVSF